MKGKVVVSMGILVLLIGVLSPGPAGARSPGAYDQQVLDDVRLCNPCSNIAGNSQPYIDPLIGSSSPYPGGFDCNPNDLSKLSYVQRVLANEWGQSWDQRSLEAGAIAARTDGLFWFDRGYKLNVGGTDRRAVPAWAQGYGTFPDGPFVNNPPNDAVRNAVNATRGQYVYYYTDTGQNAIEAKYGKTRGNWTENWASQPYLYSVPDPVRSVTWDPAVQKRLPGVGESVGPGVSQNGSQQWAQNTYDLAWGRYKILAHYYRGAIFKGGIFSDTSNGYRWLDVTANPMNSDSGVPWNAAPTTMKAGTLYGFWMRMQNVGTAEWPRWNDPAVVALSYHWLDANQNCCVVWDGRRTNLPDAPAFYGNTAAGKYWYILPGQRANDMGVIVQAPPASWIPQNQNEAYFYLEFDMVKETKWWFGQLGWPAVRIQIKVTRN
jgi:hypothetical protein